MTRRAPFLACVFAVAATLSAAPANPFHLISKQAKSFASLAQFPATSPIGKVDKAHNRITYATVQDLHLTLKAGPESNMMSFELEGLTNPEIVVPKGVRITMNVVNVDDDMIHNLYLTPLAPPYPKELKLGPEAFGTPALQPHDKGPYSGAVLIFTAAQAGTAYYVCTVLGHAARGMYGKITVLP